MLHFCNWKKNALWNRIFVLWKNCPFMTNNKNLGKRVKNQNHKCTIHRNKTNSYILTMLLEKVSIHTYILFVHCYRFFLLLLVLFLFVENCILLPKGIYEFVLFLCIVHLWFWFFTLLPRFLLLVIKGQFFHRTKILFQSAFFFSVTKM
jgi:hypothetical protein